MGAKGTNKEVSGNKTTDSDPLANDAQNPENTNAVIAVSSKRTTVTEGIINRSPMSNHSNHLMP